MSSRIEARRFRSSLGLIAFVTASALFGAYHSFPISWPAVLPFPASSLSTSTSPSAWLAEDGYLDYALGAAWGIQYTLLQWDADGYSCDEEEVLAGGQKVCRNNIRALKSLWSNTRAQQRYLADEESSNEPAISGSEGGLAEDFSRTYQDISALAGKRVLVIGDSLDRNWITELADLTAPSSYYHIYDLSSFRRAEEKSRALERPLTFSNAHSIPVHTVAERAGGFRYECGTAVIPIAPSPHLSSTAAVIGESFTPPSTRDLPQAEHQLRLDFVFACGILNESWKPTLPSNVSDLVEALRQVIGGGMDDGTSLYDAITINFGLWDLVGFQRRAYLATSTDRQAGLTVEWVAEYSQICERFIESLRNTYGPDIPIHFRLVHVTSPGDPKSKQLALPPHLQALAEAEAVPPFKPLRVAQLRRAQINLAKRMGLRSLNFAKILEGYGEEISADGVHPLPEVDGVYAEILLRQLMAR